MAGHARSTKFSVYLPDTIVIAPLKVTLGHSENYFCLGRGLLHYSGPPFVPYVGCGEIIDKHDCKFDPDAQKRLQVPEPKRIESGKVRLLQSTTQEKPLAYWKAQCAFRKLTTAGTVEDLQEVLRSYADRGMHK